jgi:DHA2 family multidrug resistance protein
MALKQINQIAHRQSVIMGFADAFLVLTALFVVLAMMALLMKRALQAAPGGGGGHR